LSDREGSLCEGDVSVEECLVVLESFGQHKSPGIDGLPYEFYLHFWDMLGSDLVDMYNACISRGSLSFSQGTGLIPCCIRRMINWIPRIGVLFRCCAQTIRSLLRDRSLFIPRGGTEEKLKKVYIKKLPNCSGCSILFYPTSNRNPRV
jgi:hypothetical protein